jgi:AcrR family transcriptional regulator
MKQEQLLKKNQRNTKGENTYKTIVEAAMDIASIEGLEGISIGNLASKIGMSKSGLFAHFGSKESLQLAIVDEARKRFFKEVIAPVRKSDKGLVVLSGTQGLPGRVFFCGCFC